MNVRRVAVRALVVLLVLGLALSAYVVVHVSREVTRLLTVPATFWPSQVRVVEASGDRVTIEVVEGGPTWLRVGEVYGLDWGSGSGQVGEVIADEGDRVERSFRLLEGQLPEAGTLARYSREVYPRDARRAFPDRAVRELTLPGPPAAPELPAWFVPGRSDTWAILVHGRGAARSEMFRIMHATVAAGLPSLAITYRAAPEAGGGQAALGRTEWRDLETAVRLARERGARDVVLAGASMGGAVIASFLERSDLAGDVRAVVLDSPLLDLATAVDEAGAGAGVPGFLTALGLRVAAWRTGVDVTAADHLDDTSWVRVPTLVLHGDSDGDVPVLTSRRLAEAEPDLVRLEVVAGAGHVESWNFEPRRCARLVRELVRTAIR